ncbi:MAG TPA: FkbM family methyltransferase [Xanthobacteraceae bacterium]|nr:FkbM family methyltransferase [Xanthobacteraceae bacterium]
MIDRSSLRDGIPHLEFKPLLGSASTIVEVGAHDGSSTESFRLMFPRARIIAFEPEPRAIGKFKARPGLQNVTLIESAVGDRNGEAVFHRSSGRAPGHEGDDWDASGSLHEPGTLKTTHQWLTFERQITVPIVRLDDEMARQGVGTIDLIWADVQGAEGDLIRGGRETLKRTRYFYTECTDLGDYVGQVGLHDMCALLPDFEIVEVFAYDVLFRNKNRNLHSRWRRLVGR